MYLVKFWDKKIVTQEELKDPDNAEKDEEFLKYYKHRKDKLHKGHAGEKLESKLTFRFRGL